MSVFKSANTAGMKNTYLLFIILQVSTVKKQKMKEIIDVGMYTRTATVIPPKELNAIKIAL